MMNENLIQNIVETTRSLRSKCGNDLRVDVGVILGSGFAKFADYAFKNARAFELREIPHMHGPKVHGHGSKLIFAELDNKHIAVMSGRIHMYEGYSAEQVVYPVRVMAALGMKNLVLTNASGSLRTSIPPGTAVLLKDHINFTGQNCLAQTPLEFGTRFVDMVNTYDADWRKRILSACPDLTEGVYVGCLGPTFETPAETQMFARLGGDVIGMSTVQEAIAARQLQIRVAGLSLATNLCGGLSENVDHEEVLAMGKRRADYLQKILWEAIQTS